MTTNKQTAEALVRELQASEGWPAPNLLRQIAAQGDAVIEPLIAAVREDDDGWVVSFAAELLAHLKAIQAVPDLVAAWRRMDDTDYLDPLYKSYAAFGEPMLVPMLEIAGDRSLAWYTRGMALEVAEHIPGGEPALIEQLTAAAKAHLSAFLQDPQSVTDDDSTMVANFILTLADNHDESARPFIKASYDAGIVDESVVDQEHIDKIYTEPIQPKRIELDVDWIDDYERHQNGERQRLVKYIDAHPLAEDLIADRYDLVYPQQLRQQPMGVLYQINSDLHELDRIVEEERAKQQIQPARNTMKIGRNDPCFCGSGKKYKHCHGKAA